MTGGTVGRAGPTPQPGPEDAGHAALVRAAAELLASDGPDALTVRRIAARAKCSTMLVYSRLGGKNGIVDALFIDGFRQLAALMRAGRNTSDPVADLRTCAGRYRKFALTHAPSYAVMFERAIPDYQPSPEALTVASQTLDILAEQVQRAIDAGAFPAQPAREIAACLWATNHGVVSLELKHVGPPDIDWAKRHRQVIDAMLAGLARADEATRPPARARA